MDKCACWRCWFQSNFTAIVLFIIVILSFMATVGLMHEDIIADKYVTWLEGFCAGAMTSLAVALKAETGVGTHRTQPPTAPPAPPEPPKVLP